MSTVPYLCGGTFFTQLLRMKKPPSRSKQEGTTGIKDQVNNQRMLEFLITFFDANFKVYSDGTFKGDTSDYKNCKESQGENLPFDDSHTDFSVFDSLIKTKYNEVLPKMEEFVDKFFVDKNETDEAKLTKAEEKITAGVKALLQIIADDEEIKSNEKFYMGTMGNPITKAELATKNEIVLEPFLLGIWHFILLHRPINTLGRETIVSWHRPPARSGKGKVWTYISKIGASYHDVYLHRYNEDFSFKAASDDVVEEVIEEDSANYESIPDDGPVNENYKRLFQQQMLLNTGTINIWNNAPGGTQAQYIGSLTIHMGKNNGK